MKTKAGRWTLVLVFLGTLAFSLWAWFRPYEWKPDPAARARIESVELKRDRSYHWVTVHVMSLEEEGIDISKSVVLQVSGGRELLPADTRLEGQAETGFSEAWYQFWLEEKDRSGPFRLGIHDGWLNVSSKESLPLLDDGESKNFTTHRW